MSFVLNTDLYYRVLHWTWQRICVNGSINDNSSRLNGALLWKPCFNGYFTTMCDRENVKMFYQIISCTLLCDLEMLTCLFYNNVW